MLRADDAYGLDLRGVAVFADSRYTHWTLARTASTIVSGCVSCKVTIRTVVTRVRDPSRTPSNQGVLVPSF